MSLSPGTDECDTDLDCTDNLDPYHYECISGTCTKIMGAGNNECMMDAQCSSSPTTTVAGATTTTVRITTTTIVIVSCSGTGVYNTDNCDNECDASCEECKQIAGLPCYRCEKECDKLGAGWDDITICNTCDSQHEDCVEHATCDDCYHCVEECPDSMDYYRFAGCDATCDNRLCRKVGEAEPQSQYKECYRCYPPVCGDGFITPPEECEKTADCPTHHTCNGNCKCITDCASFCGAQGAGYANVAGVTSANKCYDKNDPTSELSKALAAIKKTCRASCGKGAFMGGLSANCCCIKTNFVEPCDHCPCTVGVDCHLMTCDPQLAACKAGL